MSKKKKLILEIVYEEKGSLDVVLQEIRTRTLGMGELKFRRNEAICNGRLTFDISLQEPRIEEINDQYCLVFRSNM